MSLQVWLPMTKDLRNQGIADVEITNNGATLDSAGKLGGCYNFNGSNYITVVSNDLKALFSSPSNKHSMACWIYLNSDETDRVIVFGNYSANPFMNWELTANCQQRVCAGGISNYTTKGDNTVVAKQSWTHICYTYDGANTVFYVNGVKKNTDSGINTLTTMSSNTFWIGSDTRSGATRLKGKMNDFRVYDHALSPMEIKYLSQGLVLHYPLDGNNGTLVNENLLPETSSEEKTCTYPASSYKDWYQKASLVPLTESEYILSFYAKSTVNGDKIHTYFYYPNTTTKVETSAGVNSTPADGHAAFELTTEWQKFWVKYTQSETTTTKRIICPRLMNGEGTGTVSIKCIKFEEGHTPTPWCPSLQDSIYTTLGYDDGIEYDCSGFGNNLNKNGTYTYTFDTPKYFASTKFNGTEWMKGITPNADILTLSCWAKTSKNKSTSQFMVADSASKLCISFYNGTIISYFGSSGNSTGSKCTLGNSYKENDWNHFVVVKTGEGTRKIYCNGVELTPTTNDYWGSANGFFIGTRTNGIGLPFYGQICDVRAYATALSAEDIQKLYTVSASIDSNGNAYSAAYVEG